MRSFNPRAFLKSLSNACADGHTMSPDTLVTCAVVGCRTPPLRVGASYVDSATGACKPLVLHVFGTQGPVCATCFARHGGRSEALVDYLVREHGFVRGEGIPEFEPAPEPKPTERKPAGRPFAPVKAMPPRTREFAVPMVPASVATPAPSSHPRPPRAPAIAPQPPPRPAAPVPPSPPRPAAAPRPPAPASPPPAAQPQAPRRLPRGLAVPSAPGSTPTAPARLSEPDRPRARADDRRPHSGNGRHNDPREATTSLAAVLGGIKPKYATAAERERAKAEHEAAADRKWLEETCARGGFGAVPKLQERDLFLNVGGELHAYTGDITGVIVGESVGFGGTEDNVPSNPDSSEERAALRAVGWKNVRTVEPIGDSMPVRVALCTAEGFVPHVVQSTVWTCKFRPTEGQDQGENLDAEGPAAPIDSSDDGIVFWTNKFGARLAWLSLRIGRTDIDEEAELFLGLAQRALRETFGVPVPIDPSLPEA